MFQQRFPTISTCSARCIPASFAKQNEPPHLLRARKAARLTRVLQSKTSKKSQKFPTTNTNMQYKAKRVKIPKPPNSKHAKHQHHNKLSTIQNAVIFQQRTVLRCKVVKFIFSICIEQQQRRNTANSADERLEIELFIPYRIINSGQIT